MKKKILTSILALLFCFSINTPNVTAQAPAHCVKVLHIGIIWHGLTPIPYAYYVWRCGDQA